MQDNVIPPALAVLQCSDTRRALLFNCLTDHAPPDWSRFAALEIGGCRYCSDPDSGESWIDGGLSDVQAEFWTVYGRLKNGLAEAITDCPSRAVADQVADSLRQLSGLPLTPTRRAVPLPQTPLSVPRPPQTARLDQRALATVLAALRCWRRALAANAMPPEWDIANNAGTIEPMSETEIDELCERLNFQDGATSPLR